MGDRIRGIFVRNEIVTD